MLILDQQVQWLCIIHFATYRFDWGWLLPPALDNTCHRAPSESHHPSQQVSVATQCSITGCTKLLGRVFGHCQCVIRTWNRFLKRDLQLRRIVKISSIKVLFCIIIIILIGSKKHCVMTRLPNYALAMAVGEAGGWQEKAEEGWAGGEPAAGAWDSRSDWAGQGGGSG